jgi:NTE family protein
MAAKALKTERPRRVALVLGGGGMKGFAHIGVMRAIEERGITPTLFAGTSIGALLAAARVGGMALDDMGRRAESLRRRDLFRMNHLGMLVDRLRAPSIYLEEPLRALVESVVPNGSFRELSNSRLFVNTVDIESARQTVWGTPGLDDANIQDAVYSSCALPGFFPPGVVNNRICIDGGVVDNLPVQIAALNADIVIASDVGNSELRPITDLHARGFANIYMRAASTMMHALQQVPLVRWGGPPMVLIRPRLGDDWLSFTNTAESIQQGYKAALHALDGYEAYLEQPGGVFPRRHVELEVVRDKCVGCGLCVALAPNVMALDTAGKAFARTRTMDWSPADGAFVHQCPTSAIVAKTVTYESPARPAEEVSAAAESAEPAIPS